MKTIISLIALVVAVAQYGTAQSYQLVASNFTISGTSNVHDWESKVTKVNWTGSFQTMDDGTLQIKGGKVTIPVSSILSTKGRVMDNKTHEALQKDSHPNIVFTATTVNATATGTNTWTAQVKGTLTMAGVSKQVTVKAIIKSGANGRMSVSGTHAMKMTDFGISPPTALMGTMTTGDAITLKFALDFNPADKL